MVGLEGPTRWSLLAGGIGWQLSGAGGGRDRVQKPLDYVQVSWLTESAMGVSTVFDEQQFGVWPLGGGMQPLAHEVRNFGVDHPVNEQGGWQGLAANFLQGIEGVSQDPIQRVKPRQWQLPLDHVFDRGERAFNDQSGCRGIAGRQFNGDGAAQRMAVDDNLLRGKAALLRQVPPDLVDVGEDTGFGRCELAESGSETAVVDQQHVTTQPVEGFDVIQVPPQCCVLSMQKQHDGGRVIAWHPVAVHGRIVDRQLEGLELQGWLQISRRPSDGRHWLEYFVILNPPQS